MRVEVCGSGLIGSAALRAFAESADLVTQSPREVRYANFASASQLLSGYRDRPSVDVFVSAAGAANVNDSIYSPDDFLRSPASQIAAHIRLLADWSPGALLLFISSAAVYGDTSIAPATEGREPNPASPYAEGKANAEAVALSQSASLGIGLVVLRVFSAYDNSLRTRLPEVLAQGMHRSSPLELAGTGEECRDFVHTADVARVLTSLTRLERAALPKILNVGTGQPLTIREVSDIAFLTARERGLPMPRAVFSGKVRPGDPQSLVADTSLLMSLGLVPAITPSAGLASYFTQRCET